MIRLAYILELSCPPVLCRHRVGGSSGIDPQHASPQGRECSAWLPAHQRRKLGFTSQGTTKDSRILREIPQVLRDITSVADAWNARFLLPAVGRWARNYSLVTSLNQNLSQKYPSSDRGLRTLTQTGAPRAGSARCNLLCRGRGSHAGSTGSTKPSWRLTCRNPKFDSEDPNIPEGHQPKTPRPKASRLALKPRNLF